MEEEDDSTYSSGTFSRGTNENYSIVEDYVITGIIIATNVFPQTWAPHCYNSTSSIEHSFFHACRFRYQQ